MLNFVYFLNKTSKFYFYRCYIIIIKNLCKEEEVDKLKVNNIKQIGFGQALTTREKKRGEEKIREAMVLLDVNNLTLITPEASLPVDKNKNVGIGQFNSKSAQEFFDFMKSYTGMNIVKTLPQGNYHYKADGYYGAFTTCALNLGSQLINLEELTQDKYGSILSNETFNKVIEKNKETQDEGLVNFENIIFEYSPFEDALKEAYKNFKNSDNLNIKNLKKEFESYKKEYNDILEPMALYKALQKENNNEYDYTFWNKVDQNLFNTDVISEADRNRRISEIKAKYSDEMEFNYFKEFLAERNLKEAKEKLNNKNLKLMGDCLIGFSKDEVWAHPKAFADAYICSADWGLRALDYVTICDENSESNKLLKRKVELYAKRYDTIRFDVGWSYVKPILYCKTPEQIQKLSQNYNTCNNNGYTLKNPLNDKLLNIVENTVKSIKGNEFNKKDLIYEIEADSRDFSICNSRNGQVIQPFEGRTVVLSTCYMNQNYASISAIKNRMKIPRDNYVLMVGNHDHLALNAYAEEIDNDDVFKSNGNNVKNRKNTQNQVLSKELKLDEETLKTDKNEWIKAKFAHLFLARNIKIFFMDVFGRKEQFDSQKNNGRKNYRYMIPSDYEKSFHTAVQNGNGFNIYDALTKAMKAKGLDQSNEKLYEELEELSQKLYKKGVLTEAEANRNFYAKVGAISLVAALGILGTTLGIIFGIKHKNKQKEMLKQKQIKNQI